MKTDQKKNRRAWSGTIVLSLLFMTVLFGNCSDDDEAGKKVSPPDPNVPVEITSFFPDSGGVGTQLILYGRNFGTDTSFIKVTVNGKNAKVIGVNNNVAYAVVPTRADTGEVKVKIGKDEAIKELVYENKFNYLFKQNVTTFLGNGENETKDGSYKDARVRRPTWLTFDKDGALFFVEEGRGTNQDGGIRMAYNQQVKTFIRNSNGYFQQPRAIEFNVAQDTLYLANDREEDTSLGIGIFIRETGFVNLKPQLISKRVTCVAVNPVTNEVFCNELWDGYIYKFNKETKQREQQVQVAGRDADLAFLFTPDGRTLYITARNRHAIFKAKYNIETGKLEKPELFAGDSGYGNGHVDGSSTNTRFNEPCQGAFDEDGNLYVADRNNHCIRKITPEGEVTTYAGRGKDFGGYEDGEPLKSKFNNPEGVAFGPDGALYVGDMWNHRIRRILVE